MVRSSVGTSLLLVALAACGDNAADQHVIMDAPVADAPDVPPETPEITVTVFGPTGLLSGVEVYFQDADSVLEETGITDQSGTTSGVMGPGGYVTAVVPTSPGFAPSPGFALATWAGVRPGEHLIYRPTFGSATSSAVTFHLPLDGANSVVTYHVQTTCGGTTTVAAPGSGTTVDVMTNVPCSTADVFVWGTDGSNAVVSSFEVAGQTIANNGTIDYSAKTYTNAAARSFTFTNNADSTAQLTVTDHLATPRGDLFSLSFNPTSATTATATRTMPASPTGALDVIQATQQTALTFRQFVEWGTTGAYTQDWGAHLLPDFTSAPSFDRSARVVTWTTAGGSLAPDFSDVRFTASRSSPSTQIWTWEMFTPTGTMAAFPYLPTDGGDFNVSPSDGFTLNWVRTANVPGGWDAIRPTIFANGVGPTGATGTASENEFSVLSTVAARVRNLGKHGVMRRWFALR